MNSLFSGCVLIIVYFICSHPGHSEAICSYFLNPSMVEGIDELLLVEKSGIEDQSLLLVHFFLPPEPIFPDGDLLFDNFMMHSNKGWVASQTGGSAGPAVISRSELLDFL
jgi:hypothetical protein